MGTGCSSQSLSGPGETSVALLSSENTLLILRQNFSGDSDAFPLTLTSAFSLWANPTLVSIKHPVLNSLKMGAPMVSYFEGLQFSRPD
jgi:hypothetical protein